MSSTAIRLNVRAFVESVLYVAAAFGVYAYFVCTPSGQRLDASALMLSGLMGDAVPALAYIRIGLVFFAAILVSSLGVLALLRRKIRSLAIAIAVPALAMLGSQLLKAVLPRPRLGDFAYEWNTLPSGHVTATASLLVACMLLSPVQPTQAQRTFVMTMMSLAAWISVLSFAHRPSDGLAALLITGAALSITGVFDRSTRCPHDRDARRVSAVACGSAVVAFSIMAMLGKPSLLLLGVANIASVVGLCFAILINRQLQPICSKFT